MEQLKTSMNNGTGSSTRVSDAYAILSLIDEERLQAPSSNWTSNWLRNNLRRMRSIVNTVGDLTEEDPLKPLMRNAFQFVSRLNKYSQSAGESETEVNSMLHQLINHRIPGGFTFLHFVCFIGRESWIEIVVNDYGGTVDEMSIQGWTPLHVAAIMGRVKCVKELLRLGANIEARVTRGTYSYSPLRLSLFADATAGLEAFMVLLSHGADLWAVDNSHNRDTIAHSMIWCPHWNEALKILLSRDHHLAFARNTIMESPLHKATENANIDAIKILLSYGVDINVLNRLGQTPLHLVWRKLHWLRRHRTILRLLSATRVKTDERLSKLWHCRELLIERGANSDAEDRNGLTPSKLGFAAAIAAQVELGRSHYDLLGSWRVYPWENVVTNCPAAWRAKRLEPLLPMS